MVVLGSLVFPKAGMNQACLSNGGEEAGWAECEKESSRWCDPGYSVL